MKDTEKGGEYSSPIKSSMSIHSTVQIQQSAENVRSSVVSSNNPLTSQPERPG